VRVLEAAHCSARRVGARARGLIERWLPCAVEGVDKGVDVRPRGKLEKRLIICCRAKEHLSVLVHWIVRNDNARLCQNDNGHGFNYDRDHNVEYTASSARGKSQD